MNNPTPSKLVVGSVVFGAPSKKHVNIPTQPFISPDNPRRKKLIAEARGILGILEKYGGDVSEGEWARISNGPFNRLREILDELEKLP